MTLKDEFSGSEAEFGKIVRQLALSMRSAIPVGESELIREALQRGQLTGTERFIGEVEAIIGRRIENRKQGRPRKEADK